MAKCRIYETYNKVTEMKHNQSSNGLMTLSGIFGECEKRNLNNRVYNTKNYAAMVAEMKERINRDGGILGTLEHENGMTVNLENRSTLDPEDFWKTMQMIAVANKAMMHLN